MGKRDLDILLEKYEELHNLLCDYNQEKRLLEKIHSVIQGEIDTLPAGTRIGFRPYGLAARWLIRNFDFNHKSIIGMFDKTLSFSIDGVPVYKMSSQEAKDVDVFIMTSFNKRDEIVSELQEGQYIVLDIYHILEQNGISLYAPVDLYMEGGPAVLHDFLLRWKNAKDEKREDALRELLTAACEAKDFVMLKNFLEKYAEEYSFVRSAREKWYEFDALIKQLVEQRDQRDIVMYLLDAVPYKWKKYFKKLSALEKGGVSFRQAYSCTPYTDQTLRTIFSGIMPLTDWEKSLEKIGYENSALIQYLKEQNYIVCRIGEDTPICARRCIEDEFSIATSVGVSCNLVLWKILCKLLQSEGPCFLLAHIVEETHPPMLCAELERLRDVYTVDDPLEQFKISANYVDQRVSYYHGIINNKHKTQIIMSDHGEHITNQFPIWYWSQYKLHAVCFVTGNDIQPRQEERLFSYQKFTELIKWIVEPEKNHYEDCLSEYALFQDTDIYSEELISRFINNHKKVERSLAYRGALDGVYKYAINRSGREFFYKIVDDKDVEIEEQEAAERLKRLRNLAGTDFPDLSVCEKFKYVPKLYEAMKKFEEGKD